MVEMKHGREYFSPSQLKKLYLSTGNLNSYLAKVFKDTAAMDLGTAVHCALLEPDEFDKRIIVFDDTKIKEKIGGAKPASTKAYREFVSNFREVNLGKLIISKEAKDIIDRIVQNCAMTGVTDNFFTDGEAEKTIRGLVTDYDEDFEALCIIDYDRDDMSVDLKTTAKPLSKFKWDANDLGYDIQANLTHAQNGKEFVFVVVQTVEPFDVAVVTCSDYFMDRGKTKINKALLNYKSYEDEHTSQLIQFEL